MKEYLSKILSGENLTIEESESVMNLIMTGQLSDIQISAFLIALKLKGEVISEVAGFVKSMRAHSVKINLEDDNAVDGCGTGGDGSNSFNVSTAAALVASSAGAVVAKHGNRSVSSLCGSSDLLEATGGNINPGVEKTESLINNVGFGFMFAPAFHPAMKYAVPVRKELGVRTVFNILGPMTNPATVKRQIIGVYDSALMSLMAEVLQVTGSTHVMTLHAKDGLDEFSISAPTDYYELKDGKVTNSSITSEDVGLPIYPPNSIGGGDAQKNYGILIDILDGTKSAYRDAVLFNSGAMLYVGNLAESIKDGVGKSSEAIDSGKAKEKLSNWVKESNN